MHAGFAFLHSIRIGGFIFDWDNLRIFLELTRSQGLVDAAKKLGIDQSTVSRRMRKFEEQVGTQLFDRNNIGYELTPEGHRLIEYAEGIESTVYAATEELGNQNQLLNGQVRLGATEGFGTVVLAGHLTNFCTRHPHITVDLLAVPRFVNLSKREADLVITIERPQAGNYVMVRLSDYRLKLYATRSYIEQHSRIRGVQDLASHPLIGYVDDLVFSSELRYRDDIAPNVPRTFRSTSIVAQYNAARQGKALAVLPCFLAQQCTDLVPVLDKKINITRSFWLVSPTERRHVARVTALWDYLQEVIELNRNFLMGNAEKQIWLA